MFSKELHSFLRLGEDDTSGQAGPIAWELKTQWFDCHPTLPHPSSQPKTTTTTLQTTDSQAWLTTHPRIARISLIAARSNTCTVYKENLLTIPFLHFILSCLLLRLIFYLLLYFVLFFTVSSSYTSRKPYSSTPSPFQRPLSSYRHRPITCLKVVFSSHLRFLLFISFQYVCSVDIIFTNLETICS